MFVPDLEHPVITPEDHHHLARVRRVRDGNRIVLSDGRGRWAPAVMAGETPQVDGDVRTSTRPTPAVSVAFALVKGGKPELVVQKLTELGVDRVRPFVAARSVVRWDSDKVRAAQARFDKVAREAAMQSRSAWIPTVDVVGSFESVAADPQACLADREGGPLSLERPLVMVGPEGGWDDAERSASIPSVRLADGVLRAETAAIAAGVLLTALRNGRLSP